ncbi:MAG: hypothetical protein WEB58_09910 [Planctomycetaceae bacterium]
MSIHEKQNQRAVLRQDFERQLDAFEQCTETPFVPGELEQWLSAVREAFDGLVPMVKESQRIHEEEFVEIVEEDPELHVHVELMREEERAIAKELDELTKWFNEFPKRRIDGGDETEYKLDLDRFVSAALEMLVRIRKQEVTVRTWLMEAFMRDRGTVD